MTTQPTITDQLQARRYDPNKAPAPEQITMMIESQNIGTLQNFITVTGIEKAGKGKFIAAMAAAAITNEDIFGIRIKRPDSRQRVALFDTEQSDYDFYKSMQNIKRLAGIDYLPPQFDAYCTREDNPDTIIRMVETYLPQNPDCYCIFLDGLLDLIYSFNDESQCNKLVRRVMKWTKQFNCFIVAILHRSKNTGTTIGHLGSFANRKAQSILLVEKDRDNGYITLSAEHLRSSAGFNPITIYYDQGLHGWQQLPWTEENTPATTQNRKRRPGEWDISEHTRIVGQIFNSKEVHSYGNLISEIMQLYGTGRNWAVDCVPYLLSQGLIFKIGTGEYTNRRQQKLVAL